MDSLLDFSFGPCFGHEKGSKKKFDTENPHRWLLL